MTRIASRQTPLAFAARSAPAALALVLGSFLGAAPASAECSAGPMTMSAAGGQSYTCTRNCAAGGRVLATVSFSGHGATPSQCLAECDRTLGCATVSYRVSVEMRDGVPFTTVTCVLQRAGDHSTVDVAPRPGTYQGACFRDPPGGLWSDPRVQIDLRILDQDSRRAGLPNPKVLIK